MNGLIKTELSPSVQTFTKIFQKWNYSSDEKLSNFTQSHHGELGKPRNAHLRHEYKHCIVYL